MSDEFKSGENTFTELDEQTAVAPRGISVGELFADRMKLQTENKMLKADLEWLKRVFAVAIGDRTIVVREDELRDAPEIWQGVNVAGEIILGAKRKSTEQL